MLREKSAPRSPIPQHFDDPLTGSAITIGIGRLCHPALSEAVVEQLLDVAYNRVGICADDTCQAGLCGLWSFRRAAEHQNGHTQRRCFLLNPSRISEDQIGATHQRQEWDVI
jgi:hypothetical protein